MALVSTRCPSGRRYERDLNEVRVMVYHGLCYSHSGLIDPASMPAYVAVAKHLHENSMRWARLDPELAKWSEMAGWFANRDWDLGHDMQSYARPDGAERSMIYHGESNTWVARPREPQPAPKKKEKKEKPPKKEQKKKEVKSKHKKKRTATASQRVKDENKRW